MKKYHILHEERLVKESYWEVEADSYEEAIEKLHLAINDNAIVSDIANNSPFVEEQQWNLSITEDWYKEAGGRPLSLYTKEDTK